MFTSVCYYVVATFFDNFQALKQFVKRLELESCMEYLLQGTKQWICEYNQHCCSVFTYVFP